VTSSNASVTVTSEEDSAVLGLTNALLPGGQGFPAANSTGMGDLLLTGLRGVDPDLIDREINYYAAQPA
jgi:hypothetical protein